MVGKGEDDDYGCARDAAAAAAAADDDDEDGDVAGVDATAEVRGKVRRAL